MTQLTGEEWGKVAERLGMAADKLKKLINLILESGHALEEAGEEIRDIDMEEAKATLQEWRELEETMRLAVAAVLWVSENAADRVRFVMLDSHPPDRE